MSGSRASGLVRTRRLRRHIPGNGGARPGAGGAGRGLGAGAEAGRGSVEFGAVGVGGGREARAFVGGRCGRWAESAGGSGAGLAGGEDWAWGRGAGAAGAPRAAGTRTRAARGLGRCAGRRLRALPRAFFAAPPAGPSERRPGLARGATASCGAARLGSGPGGDGQRAPRARAAWEGEGRREAGGGARRGLGGGRARVPGGCVSETGGWHTWPCVQPGTRMPANPRLFLDIAVASFFTLSVSRARDLPSGAMSEGVDLIDIYADEEFNQVRGRGELGDSPGSAGTTPSRLQWLRVVPVLGGEAVAAGPRLRRVPGARAVPRPFCMFTLRFN